MLLETELGLFCLFLKGVHNLGFAKINSEMFR